MSAAAAEQHDSPTPRRTRKKSAPVIDLTRRRLEILAEALSDFNAFCGLLDIVPKEGTGREAFELNHTQRIFNNERTGRDVVLKPRQIGFTTLELARDVFHFLTVPGASVLIICQAVDGDGPLNNMTAIVSDYFDSLERAGLHLEFDIKRTHHWEMIGPDGTRAKLVVTTAPATEKAAKKLGRSGTVTRLHCTEVSVWEYDELSMNAVRECVPKRSTGSEIVIESTPYGAYGLFHRYCTRAKEIGFRLHFYPWFYHAEYFIPLDDGESITPSTEREHFLDSLGVTPEQIKWYRQKVEEKTQELVDQEYPSDPQTCFLVSGRAFFDKDATSRLAENYVREPLELGDSEQERLLLLAGRYAALRERSADGPELVGEVRSYLRDRRIRLFELPIQGREYVIGSDTSSGAAKDASSAIVYDWENGRHVATIDGHYEPHELARVLALLGLEYNTALVAVERENHGHAVHVELNVHLGYPEIYVHGPDLQVGYPTNQVTRPVMLDALQAVLKQGLWKTPDRALVGQMRTFVVGPNEKPQAAPGQLDDLVLGAAIGWAVRSIPRQDMGVGGVRRSRTRFGGGGPRGRGVGRSGRTL